MLNQLYQICQAVVGRPLMLSELDKEIEPLLTTPAGSFKAARLLVARVLLEPLKCRESLEFSLLGGLDLLVFIHTIPKSLERQLENITQFESSEIRVWQEPETNAYVSFCAAVQDVWAHIFGAEVTEDRWIEKAAFTLTSTLTLDFGAGNGHFALQLAQRGSRVFCVERDQVKKEFLKFRATQLGISDYISVFSNIPQDYKEFDLVLAINVLDHLKDPVPVLNIFSERINSEGHLLLDARFPDDGWHQSDINIIKNCASVLFERFIATNDWMPGTPAVEVFRVKCEKLNEKTTLKLRPDYSLIDKDEDGKYILTGNRFYTPPIEIDEVGMELINRLNGKNSIEEISNDLSLDDSDIYIFINALKDNHYMEIENVFEN